VVAYIRVTTLPSGQDSKSRRTLTGTDGKPVKIRSGYIRRTTPDCYGYIALVGNI